MPAELIAICLGDKRAAVDTSDFAKPVLPLVREGAAR